MAILLDSILKGDRQALARAITLIESSRKDHQEKANALIKDIIKNKKKSSTRIGLTGTPGAGKSTFIEAIGTRFIDQGHKIAVLAVDPSSQKTGGSILGDKTRMEKLSREPNAFIRPSPSKLTYGGVTSKTREAILLCEAAGFDIVIIETVGVGQTEVAASEMTDVFCLLITPAGGDELQGLKRGITEAADFVIVNKADGKLENAAGMTVAQYSAALRLLGKREDIYQGYPRATMVSSTTHKGISEINEEIFQFIKLQKKCGLFQKRRLLQDVLWFEKRINEVIFSSVLNEENLFNLRSDLKSNITEGKLTVIEATDVFERKLLRRM